MGYKIEGKDAFEYTVNIFNKVAEEYKVSKLAEEFANKESLIYKKDIFISLKSIVEAVVFTGSTETEKLEALKQAKNIYKGSIFATSYTGQDFLIKNLPNIEGAIKDLRFFDNGFNMNIYNIVNTVLAIITCQICGLSPKDMFFKGLRYMERFIESSLYNNKNWDEKTLVSDKPYLVIPIGAAGCGKSTFYSELSNVLNISCDNIRYMLFKDFGPCFQAWESTISWWVVNSLTDYYISEGYSVFYNGVNTDLEYRSPITMENSDSIFAGLPYNIRLVYFEPPVKLNEEELKELKSIDLWKNDIAKLDFNELSENVRKIMELIKNNFERTLSRTKDISEGKKEQDLYDILYSVPAPIVKLFVEQSFDRPEEKSGSDYKVIYVPRKEIPDASERKLFYKGFADKVLNS